MYCSFVTVAVLNSAVFCYLVHHLQTTQLASFHPPNRALLDSRSVLGVFDSTAVSLWSHL